jgi:hypothetical protein
LENVSSKNVGLDRKVYFGPIELACSMCGTRRLGAIVISGGLSGRTARFRLAVTAAFADDLCDSVNDV